MKKCEKCGKAILFGKLTDGLCDDCNKQAKIESKVGTNLDALGMVKKMPKDDMPDIDVDANFECNGDCAHCSKNHSGAENVTEMEQHAEEEFEGKRPCTNIVTLATVLEREADFSINLFSVIMSGFVSVEGKYKGKNFLLSMIPQEVMMIGGSVNDEEEITKASEIISTKVDPTFKKHFKFYALGDKQVNFMWGYNSFDKCKETLEKVPGTGKIILLEE